MQHRCCRTLGPRESHHTPPAHRSHSVAGQPDIVDGNNSAIELDSDDNEVDITGFAAGIGWDATTGFGSPIDTSLVDYLIRYVSPGDAVAAVATTKPKPHPKPIAPGSMNPH